MINIIGWISTLLLGLCGLPQAYKTWKTQTAADISYIFLLMWLGGEISAIIYVWNTGFQIPLLVNYVMNITIILYILKKK